MATKMSEVSSTAHDTLAQKNKDGSVVSGGHLVAKALKAEGGNKSRVTFYYLLAEHFGKLDALAG